MVEKVILREMKHEEIKRCSEIHARAFGFKHNVEGDGLGIVFDYEHYFGKYIESRDMLAFCIVVDDEIVGFITGIKIPSMSCGYEFFMDEFAVDLEQQGRGYGTEALERLKTLFPKSQGIKLTTIESSSSYEFYIKRGFVDVGFRVLGFSDEADLIIALQERINEAKKELSETMNDLSLFKSD